VRHSDNVTGLRALFVNENIGGHATTHRYIREALAERHEIESTVVDVPHPGLLRRLAGAPVPGLGRLDADFQPLRHQLAQALWVRRLVRGWREPYDVLHVYSHNAALLLADDLRARPSVVSTDCTNEQNARTLPYRRPTRWSDRALRVTRRFEEPVYRAATLVVAQSDYAASSLREDYGVPDERLRIVRFGVTVPPTVSRQTTPIPEITFVGSSLARKGGNRLLELHGRALRGRAILNIVTYERVRPAEGVRVFNDVRPGDPRLDEILARTAVFAFPSEIDKTSNAVLEAMARAVPIVAFRQGGIAELVEDGKTGLLVDPGDDDALLAALERLLDDAALAASYGEAGRRRVQERYDARKTTQELVDALGEAVALRAAG
jgi:alpha-maltose-1-phosphate synthase